MEKKKVQALAQFFAIAFPAATTEFMIAIVWFIIDATAGLVEFMLANWVIAAES